MTRCCVLLVPAAVWAAWPRGPAPIELLSSDEHIEVARAAHNPSALNVGAFDAELWVVEALPPLPVKAAPPPPPLRLQLVGIIEDEDERGTTRYRAALYDPDVDKLLIVSEGQHVGARQVTAVSALAIQLCSSGETVQTLALHSGKSGDAR